MQLNAEQNSMLAGEQGKARQWALEHQLQVGRMFDAVDMVGVSQAHMMADAESIGVAGVEFVEELAALPEAERMVTIPMITDPRGVDLDYYDPLASVIRPSREHSQFAGIRSVAWDDINTERFDAAIISTAHDAVDHDDLAVKLPLVVDTRGICKPADNVVKA